MPSVVLPRFLESHQAKIDHARKLEKICRESGGDMRELKSTHSAMDAVSLRGLPAVGPGCAGGVIRGTQPESATVAKLSRE